MYDADRSDRHAGRHLQLSNVDAAVEDTRSYPTVVCDVDRRACRNRILRRGDDIG
jgi:hypothetical protein